MFTENGNLPLIKLSQLLNKRSSLNAIVYLEFAAVLIGEEGIATKTGLKGTTAELEFIRIRRKREQTRDMKKKLGHATEKNLTILFLIDLKTIPKEMCAV